MSNHTSYWNSQQFVDRVKKTHFQKEPEWIVFQMTHVIYDPALLILIAILFCGILRHVPLFISKFPSNNQNPLTKINPHFPALAMKGRNARFAQSYHPTALIWSRSHCPLIVLDAYSLHSLFPPYFHSSFPGSCPIFFLSADSAHPIPQLPSMALGHWKIGSNVFTNPNTLIKSTKFSLKVLVILPLTVKSPHFQTDYHKKSQRGSRI